MHASSESEVVSTMMSSVEGVHCHAPPILNGPVDSCRRKASPGYKLAKAIGQTSRHLPLDCMAHSLPPLRTKKKDGCEKLSGVSGPVDL